MESQDNQTKYFHSIELTNGDRLEASHMVDQLKESKILPSNINLGQFISSCYFRGLNEYRKDLLRRDT